MKNKIKENSGISTRHKPYVMGKDSASGITLIALIVTIVVLIILAAISINTLVNGNIIRRAQQASEIQERAAQQEANELEELSKLLGEEPPEDAVAKTIEKYYTSLELAIDDAKEDTKTEIFLLKDIEENVKIPNNKDIELYMNGHTQSNVSEDQVTISVER